MWWQGCCHADATSQSVPIAIASSPTAGLLLRGVGEPLSMDARRLCMSAPAPGLLQSPVRQCTAKLIAHGNSNYTCLEQHNTGPTCHWALTVTDCPIREGVLPNSWSAGFLTPRHAVNDPRWQRVAVERQCLHATASWAQEETYDKCTDNTSMCTRFFGCALLHMRSIHLSTIMAPAH